MFQFTVMCLGVVQVVGWMFRVLDLIEGGPPHGRR